MSDAQYLVVIGGLVFLTFAGPLVIWFVFHREMEKTRRLLRQTTFEMTTSPPPGWTYKAIK